MQATTEPTQSIKGLPTPTFPTSPQAPPSPSPMEPTVTLPAAVHPDSIPTSPVLGPTEAEMQEVADMARVIATMTPVKQPAEPMLNKSYGEKCPARLELPSVVSGVALAATISSEIKPLPDEQWDDEPSASDAESTEAPDEEASGSFEDDEDDDKALEEDEMKAAVEDELLLSGSPLDVDGDDFLQLHAGSHDEKKPAATTSNASAAAMELARLKAESAALMEELEKVKKYKEALAKLKTDAPPLNTSQGGKSPAAPKAKPTEPKEPVFKYTVRADTIIPNTVNPAASAAMAVATLAEKWGERAREKYLTLYDEAGPHLKAKAKAVRVQSESRVGPKVIFNASERAKINAFAEAWEIYSLLRLFAVSLSRARVEMTELSMARFVEFVFSGNAHANHQIPALGIAALFSGTGIGGITGLDSIDKTGLLVPMEDTGVDIEAKPRGRSMTPQSGKTAAVTSDVVMKVEGYYEAGTDLYEQLKADLFTVVNDEKRIVSAKQDMISYKRGGDRNMDICLEKPSGYVAPPTDDDLRVFNAAPAPKKRKAGGEAPVATEAMKTKKWRKSEDAAAGDEMEE
jgi:hypothetical protein